MLLPLSIRLSDGVVPADRESDQRLYGVGAPHRYWAR